jgi:hypothetical protein
MLLFAGMINDIGKLSSMAFCLDFAPVERTTFDDLAWLNAANDPAKNKQATTSPLATSRPRCSKNQLRCIHENQDRRGSIATLKPTIVVGQRIVRDDNAKP